MATQNKEKYQFYDVKAKKKFTPEQYTVKTKNDRRFGVAKSPHSGNECWRVLGMVKTKKKKK